MRLLLLRLNDVPDWIQRHIALTAPRARSDPLKCSQDAAIQYSSWLQPEGDGAGAFDEALT
jgi:hypothetical protein